MPQVVIDSMIPDELLDVPGALKAMREGIARGDVELFVVYITEDENALAPQPDGRATRLLEITTELCEPVGAGASLFGVGRYGLGPYGGAAIGQEDLVAAVAQPTGRHAEDAIIAASAGHAGMSLATGDKRLAERARSEGLPVLMTDELFKLVGFDWAAARVQAGMGLPKWCRRGE